MKYSDLVKISRCDSMNFKRASNLVFVVFANALVTTTFDLNPIPTKWNLDNFRNMKFFQMNENTGFFTLYTLQNAALCRSDTHGRITDELKAENHIV